MTIQTISKNYLKYFDGTVVFPFLKIPFPLFATVFSNNLVLYLKDLTFF